MIKKTISSFIVLLFIFVAVGQAQNYVSIPGQAFKPWTDTEDYANAYYVFMLGYYYHTYMPSTGGYLTAPVYFPTDQTMVKCLSVRLLDNDASARITVTLYRKDLYSGTVQTVFQCGTTDGYASGGTWDIIHDGAGPNKWIDNIRYAWFVQVYFSGTGTNLAIDQVRIKY